MQQLHQLLEHFLVEKSWPPLISDTFSLSALLCEADQSIGLRQASKTRFIRTGALDAVAAIEQELAEISVAP